MPYSVIFIDDDPLEHHLVSRLLDRDGRFTLRCFLSVEDAEEAIRQDRPGVVLLDSRIPPETDHRQSVATLRSLGVAVQIVVVSSVLNPQVQGQDGDLLFFEKDDVTADMLAEIFERRS